MRLPGWPTSTIQAGRSSHATGSGDSLASVMPTELRSAGRPAANSS